MLGAWRGEKVGAWPSLVPPIALNPDCAMEQCGGKDGVGAGYGLMMLFSHEFVRLCD